MASYNSLLGKQGQITALMKGLGQVAAEERRARGQALNLVKDAVDHDVVFSPGTGPIAIVNYVHLASDHVQAAHATGWSLAELHERVIDDDWIEREPGLAKYRYKPISLGFSWLRNQREDTR